MIAFQDQRAGAQKRGIEWRFSFKAWLEWWGDDYEFRGREGHQLVMARYEDTGPYEVGNVHKITAAQNMADHHMYQKQEYQNG